MMLVFTIVLTGLILGQVKPRYVATATVQLDLPSQEQGPARNPWLTQDVSTIGNAALVSVTDVGYIASLKAAGYSDAYSATMAGDAPDVTFRATGTSAAQASSTADRLVTQFDQHVALLQTSYGVTVTDLITSRRLNADDSITKSFSNLQVALAEACFVGLLMAVAVTIWMTRRSGVRRRNIVPESP